MGQPEALLSIDHLPIASRNPPKNAQNPRVVAQVIQFEVLGPGLGTLLNQPEEALRISTKALDCHAHADEISHAARPHHERPTGDFAEGEETRHYPSDPEGGRITPPVQPL